MLGDDHALAIAVAWCPLPHDQRGNQRRAATSSAGLADSSTGGTSAGGRVLQRRRAACSCRPGSASASTGRCTDTGWPCAYGRPSPWFCTHACIRLPGGEVRRSPAASSRRTTTRSTMPGIRFSPVVPVASSIDALGTDRDLARRPCVSVSPWPAISANSPSFTLHLAAGARAVGRRVHQVRDAQEVGDVRRRSAPRRSSVGDPTCSTRPVASSRRCRSDIVSASSWSCVT